MGDLCDVMGEAGVFENLDRREIETLAAGSRELSLNPGELNDDLVRLVKGRLVDPREAYGKSVDKSDMESRLRVAGFNVQTPGH